MPNYAGIQAKIDHGLGIAASKLGWPHSVYRVAATSTGDFPDAWTTLATSVLVFRKKATDRYLESSLQASGTLWYDLLFNATPYVVGDVFIQTDPPYSPGKSYGPGATLIPQIWLTDSNGKYILDSYGQPVLAPGSNATFQLNGFALAWHRPIMKPVGARIDRRLQIYRPAAAPQAMLDNTQRWSMTENDGLPLVLSNGTFSFGTAGDAGSFIPAGFGSTDRPPRGQNFAPSTPGTTPIVRWYAYVPYLPGYEPSEGDMLRMEDGSRYIVINPWEQEAGTMGSQLFLERLISQDK